MYKQSPGRNNRAKGIKVKRILQICLLLAVCFWLVYQVKRSHGKKKEFDAKEAKLMADMERAGEIMKLGRKDLPRLGNASKDEKLVEDDEKNEVEEEEEEDKHEEDEQGREDTKVDEREEDEEDMSRGGGDDELGEAEAEHDEEFIDDEKEREEVVDDTSGENGDDGKRSHLVTETSKEEQDHDGARRNSHEAQEELYKADDASSAVAHDTGASIPATTDTSGNVEQSTEGKVFETVRWANATTAEERNSAATNLTDLKNSSLPNSTMWMESIGRAEYHNKPVAENAATVPVPSLSDGIQATFNISAEKSLKGSTDTTDSEKGQGVVGSSISTSDGNLAEAAANTVEHDIGGDVESLSKNMTMYGLTEGQINVQDSSKTNDVAGGRSEDANTDSSVHDPIAGTDTSIREEEKEARMDSSTLPEIRDDVGNMGKVAEE